MYRKMFRNIRLYKKSAFWIEKIQIIYARRNFKKSNIIIKYFKIHTNIYQYNVTVRNLWDRVEGKPKEDLYDVILE